MKYLPLATISFLVIVLSIFALTADLSSTSKIPSAIPALSDTDLQSFLGNSQENRMSIQYTTESEPTQVDPLQSEPSTIQVVPDMIEMDTN